VLVSQGERGQPLPEVLLGGSPVPAFAVHGRSSPLAAFDRSFSGYRARRTGTGVQDPTAIGTRTPRRQMFVNYN
jgi:hypothetical protein